MKQLYWDKLLIHIIASYLDKGEDGILNLLSPKYYNPKLELNINGFILNDKMRQWFCNNFNFDIDKVDCNWSAKNGYLNCLIYCNKLNLKWDCGTIELACEYDNLDCLKYLYENGCEIYTEPDYHILDIATWSGSLSCLKYLWEDVDECWNNHIETTTCSYAAENGHLDCLIYCHRERISPLNHLAVYYSKKNGHMDCYNYCIKHVNNKII